MRTISYRIGDLSKAVIHIGRVAENECTRVQIDAGEIYADYPSAAVSLTVQPPAGEAYPAVVTRDGNMVVWDVPDSALTAEGSGEIQLTFTADEVVVKSAIGRISVCRSILGNGEIPDPLEDFLAEAGAALTAIPETIDAALAEAKASGEFDGADGRDGTDGTDGQDGFSPVVEVESITGGHSVSVTDAGGTQTFNVMDGVDGQDGQDGRDGQDGQDGVGVPAGGTTGQVLSKKSGTDYDTEWTDSSGGGGTSNYNDLSNKPQIGGTTLSGNKTLSDLGIASTSDVSAKYTKPGTGIPSTDLASGVQTSLGKADSAYQKPSGGIPSSDMASAVQTSLGKADTAYQKPSGGIPSSDMASGVQTSLGKADTAYQKPSGGIPASDIASGVIPDPASIIDDTAGDGDTGKVWSADKLHDEKTALAGLISQNSKALLYTPTNIDSAATTSVVNGSESDSADSNAVRTASISIKCGDKVTITTDRPLPTGHYYVFGSGLYDALDNFINHSRLDYGTNTQGRVSRIVDIPEAYYIRFTIAETDGEQYYALRTTDFTNYHVYVQTEHDKLEIVETESFTPQPWTTVGSSVYLSSKYPTIKVMSYNTAQYTCNRSGAYIDNTHIQAFRKMLLDLSPDFVCTQEDPLTFGNDISSPEYLWQISMHEWYNYVQTNPNRLYCQTSASPGGLLVFSNEADSTIIYACFSMTVNSQSKTLLVVGTHATWSVGSDGYSAESIAKRLAQYTELLGWVSGSNTMKKKQDGTNVTVPSHTHTIIMMDANTATNTDKENLLTLAHSKNMYCLNGDFVGWLNTCKDAEDIYALDNILISNNIVLKDFKVHWDWWKKLYSDHAPLTAELILH